MIKFAKGQSKKEKKIPLPPPHFWIRPNFVFSSFHISQLQKYVNSEEEGEKEQERKREKERGRMGAGEMTEQAKDPHTQIVRLRRVNTQKVAVNHI